MDIYDFSFRGETLSSHGYMLCNFESSSSAAVVNTDSQREFSSISMFMGKYYPLLYYTYKGALTMEMSICKVDDSVDYIITSKEAASIKRWLSCPIANELRIGGDDYKGVYWDGTFQVEEIHFASDRIGFHLTFTSTAPFGYKDKVELSGKAEKGSSIIIDDTSDEEGYIYPDIKIKLEDSGDLVLLNNSDDRKTVVNHCSKGETLTFTRFLQILSDNKAHVLGDDFNYKFVRINNEYGSTINKIIFNLPCTYSISYNPIAKVVIS